MITLGRQEIQKMFYNGQRINYAYYGKQPIYGIKGWCPDPILPNDPYLNGVRIKVVVNETNPEDRKVFFTGVFYNANITSIDFGDGTSATTVPEYHQYENGEYWLVIEGHIPEIQGGDIPQPGGVWNLASSIVSSNLANDGQSIFYENRLFTELYIGDDVGLQTLDAGAFTGWTAMTKMRLPNTLERIGVESFEACTAIEVIDLRNCVNLKTIDEYSFDSLKNLRKVILPENLNQIIYTFNYCDNLDTVVFLHDDFVKYNDKFMETIEVILWHPSFIYCSEDMTLYVRPNRTSLYDYYQQYVFPAFSDIKETDRGLF